MENGHLVFRLEGWRKFLIALAFWFSSSLGLGFGWLSGGEFVAVTGLVVGLYAAGNVGEYAARRGNGQ